MKTFVIIGAGADVNKSLIKMEGEFEVRPFKIDEDSQQGKLNYYYYKFRCDESLAI